MPVFRVPATITWPGQGSPGVNVWSVRTTEGSIIQDELELALGAIDTFYEAIRLYLAPGTTGTVGADIVDRESLSDESRPTRSAASSAVTSAFPYFTQMCIGWKTALRARRGMGRTFVGPMSRSADGGDGTPSDAAVTALKAAGDALIDASDSANGWAVGVWGLVNPGQYDALGRLLPGQPHVHRDLVACKVRDQFAVLRSRRD